MSVTVIIARDEHGAPSTREVYASADRYVINDGNLDVAVQGVGTLQSVATRRGFTAARIRGLERRGAVAESLGYFFDITGKVVEAAGGVGMRLEDLGNAAHVIAVAGGASKAAAIRSLLNTGLQHVLVTDEAAAHAILSDGRA